MRVEKLTRTPTVPGRGGGDIPPHSMGWRRADPTARTPTVRTHAAMIFISYYGQRRTGQVLKISVMKGRLFI
jgi:hypothetical protein